MHHREQANGLAGRVAAPLELVPELGNPPPGPARVKQRDRKVGRSAAEQVGEDNRAVAAIDRADRLGERPDTWSGKK